MRGHLILLVSLLCASFLASARAQHQPRVTIENGVVVGRFGTSRGGKLFRKFEGIPFAKPPVDGRRFKEPERLEEEWIGEWNATSPGSPCLQYDQYTRTRSENGDIKFSIVGDEDCLFVNVYAHERGPKNKHVAVFIHGGAFMFGAGHFYGPEYVMDNDDMVFVTFNYRLGPLGFLTTGDSFVPGNNGLKDQVAALEWVQRNIAAFGGDPGSVTLVGLSAGGASVHFHFLSPLSKGLFTKGYSYSGTALCPWVIVEDGVQKTKQLATYLGCPTKDSKTILKCLRRRPARSIVEQVKNFQPWLYNPFTVFGPVVEAGSTRPFIDKTPVEILRNGEAHDSPWLTGYTTEDGLYPAADFVDDDRLLQQLNEKWEELAPVLWFYSREPRRAIAKELKEIYLGQEDFSRATVPQIIKLYSDRLFISPAVQAATLQAKVNKESVFLYEYGFKGTKSVSQLMSGTDTTFGVCHGDDMAYVVKFYDHDSRLTDEDEAMAEILNEVFMTFVRTGAPPKALKWEPVSKEPSEAVKYLMIHSPDRILTQEGRDIGSTAKWDRVLGRKTGGREEL